MKKLFAAVAALCLAATATAASATVFLNTGSLSGLAQVHSTGAQSGSNTVFGVTQGVGGKSVTIQGGSNLSVSGAGYAQFNGPFSTASVFFTSYTGGFSAINFGLFAPGVNGANGVPAYLDITVYDLNNNVLGLFSGVDPFPAINNYSLSQGLNSFNIQGDDGEIFSRVDFAVYSDTANTALRSIGDIRHIDLTAAPISAVPEPATWGMMIVGFAGIGAAMRRNRRKLAFAAA